MDVAAVDITDLISGYLVKHVNELETDAVHDPRLAQDVFVIGFPFGAITGAPAPVWKRGTIALDPTYDIEGLPKIFIDTATREGMSGSVVVARHLLWGVPYKKKDGSNSDPILMGQHDTVSESTPVGIAQTWSGLKLVLYGDVGVSKKLSLRVRWSTFRLASIWFDSEQSN